MRSPKVPLKWTLAIVLATFSLASGGHPQSRKESHVDRIVRSALDQTTWGTVYDPSYVRIGYPGGDVPRAKGVCTDVVIRALRAVGIDLQSAIQIDAKRSPGSYPGIKRRDPNIDHRRCPNQIAYFSRHEAKKPHRLDPKSKSDWLAGDIVFWKLPGGKDHVGILTHRRNAAGWPYAVHNIGAGPREEDVLASWTLVARFRIVAP